MSDPTGIDDIIARLRGLQQQVPQSLAAGADAGAALIERTMADTDVYVGMSGATRASTVAFVATPDDPGDIAPLEALATAESLLNGFTGHQGQPELNDTPGPAAGHVWIVATVPTDYAVSIVAERGDFIGDAVLSEGPAAAQAAFSAVKAGWR